MVEITPIPKVKIGLPWDMNIGCLYESTRGRKCKNLGCEDKEEARRWTIEAETLPSIMFLHNSLLIFSFLNFHFKTP